MIPNLIAVLELLGITASLSRTSRFESHTCLMDNFFFTFEEVWTDLADQQGEAFILSLNVNNRTHLHADKAILNLSTTYM